MISKKIKVKRRILLGIQVLSPKDYTGFQGKSSNNSEDFQRKITEDFLIFHENLTKISSILRVTLQEFQGKSFEDIE